MRLLLIVLYFETDSIRPPSHPLWLAAILWTLLYLNNTMSAQRNSSCVYDLLVWKFLYSKLH